MKIVHLCSQYFTSKLYTFLFDGICNHGNEQIVYVPLYKGQQTSYPFSDKDDRRNSKENHEYIYDTFLDKSFRYLLITRTIILSKRIEKKCNTKNSILHAHTLFSNGGIAYWLSKKYSIEYITAVRNTDIELLKRAPIYKKFAIEIMKKSKKIIFISYSLKNNFLKYFCENEINCFKDKILIIPNGIPEFWVNTNEKVKNKEFKFVYLGNFHTRKNVLYCLSIIDKLNDLGYNCKFDIYGDGIEKEQIIKTIKDSSYSNNYNVYPWVRTMDEIKKHYIENDIYIMPSTGETFGIAYLEALACGLPIVYKLDDGIDGFFNDIKVGVGLSIKDFDFDINQLKELLDNYNEYQENTIDTAMKFLWKSITEIYDEVYNEIK